jgi:hypothetical protein
MNERRQTRSLWLTIRLNAGEEEKLNKFYHRTTCNSLSEYARDILLKEPINVLYRNQSADDFLTEMIGLKKELNAIGNNLNQALRKLHTLDYIQEIKMWLIFNETSIQSLLKKVDEIKEKMNKIYEQWLQK